MGVLEKPYGSEIADWYRLGFARRFRIVDALDDKAPHVFDGRSGFDSGFKRHIKCPHDADHSNSGEVDSATFITNAGDSTEGESFVVFCQHGSCKSAQYGSLGQLQKMVDNGWLCYDDLYNPDYLHELEEEEEAAPVVTAAPTVEVRKVFDDAKATPLKRDKSITILENINREYALCLNGSSLVYIKESKQGQAPKMLSRGDFKDLLAPLRIEVKRGKDGETKTVPAAAEWVNWSNRRYYDEIVFEPAGALASVYNLWNGWPVAGVEGDWSLLRGHILDNICNGDEGHYGWLMDWLAQIFQQPGKKLGTAVVVRGKKGTGKSKLFDWVAKAMGRYAIKVTDPKHVTGSFNAHHREGILMIAEEAFWGGSKQSEGKLKDMITSDRTLIEAKGVDAIEVSNFLRLAVISNEDWVVPATYDERRYFVLTCSDARRKDLRYFAAIDEQMEKGGLEAMIHELMNRKFDALALRDPPVTTALQEQVVEGLNAVEMWMIGIVDDGMIPQNDGYGDGVGVLWKEDEALSLTDDQREQFCNAYINVASRPKSGVFQASNLTFGKMMKKLVADLVNHKSNNKRVYVLPPRRTVRDDLFKRYGAAVFGD